MTLRQAQGERFGDRAVELAGFASALLGWRPEEFWRSTPAELATALGLDGEPGAEMDRSSLERLLSRFPDNREK
jgi:uncharacterized phage protein (TIGR02216 family)